MELQCSVQNYAWGKLGKTSEVALLANASDPQFTIKDNVPYAELWMGTHPNSPSVIKNTGQKLGDWIQLHEESVGNTLHSFGKNLPYLFKVLSVNKALSIQAHPSKEHAEELHKTFPDIYKDLNHKPEIAIALTEFEALCGFRPLEEIKQYLEAIPELQVVIGKEYVAPLLNACGCEVALKKCFHQLMLCANDVVKEQLQLLVARLTAENSAKLLGNLLNKLHSEFPGDVGCFCIYFFNHVILKPGESIFLGPNVPHAYLSGDCIECMASSDNVVRAGLTPKYKDIETLCQMLQYKCESSEAKLFKPFSEDKFTVCYQPPIQDFSVAYITIPSGAGSYTLIPRKNASIFIVVEGESESDKGHLKRGTIMFLPANECCSINSSDNKLSIFQAFANV